MYGKSFGKPGLQAQRHERPGVGKQATASQPPSPGWVLFLVLLLPCRAFLEDFKRDAACQKNGW